MKVNVFAVIGLIFFNLVFVLGLAISVYTIVASLWIILGAFIISPVILFITTFYKIQDFSMVQSIASVVLCSLGMALIPICKKITRFIIDISVNYIEYNKKMIYGFPVND